MSKMKITKKEYTFIVDGKEYVLVRDDSYYDLFYSGKSLKVQKLAKDTAMDLLRKLVYEKDLLNLDNHPEQNLPHVDEVLKFLEEIIERIINETK